MDGFGSVANRKDRFFIDGVEGLIELNDGYADMPTLVPVSRAHGDHP